MEIFWYFLSESCLHLTFMYVNVMLAIKIKDLLCPV